MPETVKQGKGSVGLQTVEQGAFGEIAFAENKYMIIYSWERVTKDGLHWRVLRNFAIEDAWRYAGIFIAVSILTVFVNLKIMI